MRLRALLASLVLLTTSLLADSAHADLALPLPGSKQSFGPESFHQYAIVSSSRSAGIRGLKVRRMDGAIAQPVASQLCPRTGGWIYATQWLAMPGGWLEIGTGYACTGQVVTYWGHGDRHGWHWDGVVRPDGTTATAHVYEIRYAGGRRWQALVDGRVLGSITWSSTAAGYGGQAGLESYTAAASVSGMSMTALRVLRDGRWQQLPPPVQVFVDRDMLGVGLPDGRGIAPGQAPTVAAV